MSTFATSGDKVRLETEAFPTQSRRTCCLHGRLSGVRCGASTLCSHLEACQQHCLLNIHTSQSALLEEGAAEAFSRSPSVLKRRILRVTLQGGASAGGRSPDGPAAVSLKSSGEMNVISCREIWVSNVPAPSAGPGNPAMTAMIIKQSCAF